MRALVIVSPIDGCCTTHCSSSLSAGCRTDGMGMSKRRKQRHWRSLIGGSALDWQTDGSHHLYFHSDRPSMTCCGLGHVFQKGCGVCELHLLGCSSQAQSSVQGHLNRWPESSCVHLVVDPGLRGRRTARCGSEMRSCEKPQPDGANSWEASVALELSSSTRNEKWHNPRSQ